MRNERTSETLDGPYIPIWGTDGKVIGFGVRELNGLRAPSGTVFTEDEDGNVSLTCTTEPGQRSPLVIARESPADFQGE